MKKWRRIFALVLAVACAFVCFSDTVSAATGASVFAETRYYIALYNLNVRSGPSTGYSIVGGYSEGEYMQIDVNKAAFHNSMYNDYSNFSTQWSHNSWPYVGYIRNDLICPWVRGCWRVDATSGANLRSSAMIGDNIIVALPNGTYIEWDGTTIGEWYYVVVRTSNAEGRKGYIHESCIQEV